MKIRKKVRRGGGGEIKPSHRLWKAVRPHVGTVLDGMVVGIDPSCFSESSSPGYSIWEGGVERERGTLDEFFAGDIIRLSLEARLQVVGHAVRALLEDADPGKTIVAVERISSRPYGARRFSSTAHASLTMSVGAAIAGIDTGFSVLFVRPSEWHAHTPEDYVKGDAADASAIAGALVAVAGAIRDRPMAPRHRRGGSK